MKTERKYPKAIITKKGEKFTANGHPWIYDTEVISINGNYDNGDIVDAVSESGKYIGSGFVSLNSKIRIRLISRNANDCFDKEFYKRRIKYAWDYRKTVMGEDIDCCRVIFGESDQFPGLTVDKYNTILVTQILSFGIEKIKDIIFECIFEVLKEDNINITGIYERNDVNLRSIEGLSEYKGWYTNSFVGKPSSAEIQIIENGIKYKVDIENGQKTGFFLDQKYNRLAVSKYAKGKKVLDCFTHTGSFALNAAHGGAEYVLAADISAQAIDVARYNAKENGYEDIIDFKIVNVFDLLPEIKEKQFDFIILDPPAFTKSRKTILSAYKGYKEINYRAMKLLPRGGYLATCSCSHFMDNDKFVKMLLDAASDANVQLRQIESRQQSPDHPILWNVPETDYLKFYIFQVI